MDGTAYIAIGTNLGDRSSNLAKALSALTDAGLRIVSMSRVYESAPMYVTEQPPFLNAAAIATEAPKPLALLDLMLRIESQLGRVRDQRFGPRVIDLDLILYGDRGEMVLDVPQLTLPHPRAVERPFVLVPMAEIAGHIVHPTCGRTFAELAEETDHSTLCTLGPLLGM